MSTSSHSGSIVAVAGSGALRGRRSSGRLATWVAALHVPLWPAIAAALALAGLLFAFQQVLRGAVQQGQARRVAAAAQADGLWRCNAVRDPGQREQCRLRLDAAAGR